MKGKHSTAASNKGYAEEAADLLVRYELLDVESVHAGVLQYFHDSPCSIVDIGAGSGRDAAYFAARGHKVVAVEPTRELLEGAKRIHTLSTVKWVEDSLPDLQVLLTRLQRFDMVLLTAVWMHLDRDQRSKGMQNIARLVRSGSRVFMKLRHGSVPAGRTMFEVPAQETIELARPCGLACIHCETGVSIQRHNAADDVSWTDLVLEMD